MDNIQEIIVCSDDEAVVNRLSESVSENSDVLGFKRRVFVVNPYRNFVKNVGLDISRSREATIFRFGYNGEYEEIIVDDIIAWIGDNPKVL